MKYTDAMPGTVYHERLALLKTALGFLRGEDKFVVACHLGDIGWMMRGELHAQDVLRVGLAAGMLGRNKEVREAENKELRKRTEWMVKSWKVCSNEEIRRLGMEVGKWSWGF